MQSESSPVFRPMDIRVTLFEDNTLFREAMEAILKGTQGFTCGGAFPDCTRLAQHIERSRPDVVLMDIEMPGKNGIEATREIKSKFPHIKVLIQTVFQDTEKIFEALCAGASGYILKNDPPGKYLEAIAEVYSGGAPMSTTIAKKVLGFFSNHNVILVAPKGEDYQLTEREKELLKWMAEGTDYKAIAGKAYISYDTVRTHVKNIYRKLHVTSRHEAVMKAIQEGLV